MEATLTLGYFFCFIFLGAFVWELKKGDSKYDPLIITIILNIVILILTLFLIDYFLQNVWMCSFIAILLNTALLLIFNFSMNFGFSFKNIRNFSKENHLKLLARLGILSITFFVIFTIIILVLYLYKPHVDYSNFVNTISLIGTMATLLSILPLLLGFLKEN